MELADWLAIRGEKPKKTDTIWLCADIAALEQMHSIQAAVWAGTLKGKTLETDLVEARAAIESASIEVPVESMDPDEYLELKKAHRPTDPAALKAGHQFVDKTFWPALFAASIGPNSPVGPKDVPGLWAELLAGERDKIKDTCWSLNESVPDLSFMKPGTGMTAGIGPRSTTAPPEE